MTTGKKRNSTYIASSISSLNSRGLRGAVASSLVVALTAHKLFGFGFKRSFTAFFLLIWSLTYKSKIVERPVVSFHRSYWNNSLVEKMALPPFHPVFWAWNRHAQTIACFALSHLEQIWNDPLSYEREIVPAFDPPNVLHLDWASHHEQAKHKIAHASGPSDQACIICIPGLGDDRNAPYVDRFVRSALRAGYRVAVHSYWRYDFEESRDLADVLDAVATRYPSSPIIAIAWSAGVYTLTRYLEKTGGDTPLISAICQAGCLDFPQAVQDVLENENPTYGVFLDLQGRVCMRRHLDNDRSLSKEQVAQVEAAMAQESHPLKLYARFLDIIRPPGSDIEDPRARHALGHEGWIGNQGSLEERMATASHSAFRSIDNMHRIRVTTLLLHAEDDPVVSSQHVDWAKVESNKHLIVAHTKRGGHCAWYQGSSPFGETWGDEASLKFVSACLEQTSQAHFFSDLIRQTISRLQISGGGGGGGFATSNNNNYNGGFTAKAMSRICSVSDFAN